MFVIWKRRRLRPSGYHSTRCRHAAPVHPEPADGRWRLTPVVAFSLRDGAGAPRQEIIWRPKVSINSCCLPDVRARDGFWKELDLRIEALRKPPLDESAGAAVLDRIDWLRLTIAQRVPLVTDDEYAEDLEEQLRASADPGGAGARSSRIAAEIRR